MKGKCVATTILSAFITPFSANAVLPLISADKSVFKDIQFFGKCSCEHQRIELSLACGKITHLAHQAEAAGCRHIPPISQNLQNINFFFYLLVSLREKT
jgi:hypothetical protein